MSNNYRRSTPASYKGGRMIRKPYTALSYSGPVEYLPTCRHRPLEAGYHEIPIHGSEARVVVCAGPDGNFLTITVGQQKPR